MFFILACQRYLYKKSRSLPNSKHSTAWFIAVYFKIIQSFLLGCFSVDIIGSCAFGLDCNSFKEPDSQFLKHGRKLFHRTFLQNLGLIFANSFPKLAKYLHIKLIPSELSNFFYNTVSETVKYREENNVTRKDFLQLLIDIKNGRGDAQIELKGNIWCMYVCMYVIKETCRRLRNTRCVKCTEKTL